jgi:hypothetical protein
VRTGHDPAVNISDPDDASPRGAEYWLGSVRRRGQASEYDPLDIAEFNVGFCDVLVQEPFAFLTSSGLYVFIVSVIMDTLVGTLIAITIQRVEPVNSYNRLTA